MKICLKKLNIWTIYNFHVNLFKCGYKMTSIITYGGFNTFFRNETPVTTHVIMILTTKEIKEKAGILEQVYESYLKMRSGGGKRRFADIKKTAREMKHAISLMKRFREGTRTFHFRGVRVDIQVVVNAPVADMIGRIRRSPYANNVRGNGRNNIRIPQGLVELLAVEEAEEFCRCVVSRI